MVEVTIRYRLPLERAIAPIVGSTITTESAESDARSGSAMTPSFICRRTAKSDLSCSVGAREPARDEAEGLRMVRDGGPGLAGRPAQYTREARRYGSRRQVPPEPRPTTIRRSRTPLPAGVATKA